MSPQLRLAALSAGFFALCAGPALALSLSSYSWLTEGGTANAGYGSIVATAGDVNGDGYSDVLVTAPLADTLGRATLYLGSPAGIATAASWTAGGVAIDEGFGASIASAGDVNGDGYHDVIVGEPGYTNGQTREGRALLYLGSASGLSSTPSWTVESNVTTAQFGQSVSSAGDINGDGYDDVIVGAPLFDADQTDEGRAAVYYGSSAGLGAVATTIDGNLTGAAFGASVSLAGDVNADGFADVIVGAPGYRRTFTAEGRVTVYLGASGGLNTTAAWSRFGLQVGAGFGASVSLAGDVNGDGYSDVITGAPLWDGGVSNGGHVLIHVGSAAGLDTIPVWTFEGQIAGANIGISVATAGDVNGDGFADVLVGAPYTSSGGSADGQAFLFLGAITGPPSTPSWTGTSGQPASLYGRSVATLGDVNGDGFSDVGIGSPQYDMGQSNEGAAFEYNGLADALVPVYAWTVSSGQSDAHMGVCSSPAGDVNGDGYADFVVGAYRWDNTFNNEGRLQLYLGGPSGPSAIASWTGYGGGNGAWFGLSANAAGDVNGDGYGDVIVGSPQWSNAPYQQCGRVQLFLGEPTGLASTPSWTIEGTRDTMWLGVFVNKAGDLNGDGYGDVVVGASKYSNGQYQEGLVQVYMGSPAGLSTTPAWSMESDLQKAQLGVAACSAGDVNGDGYSDLAVGAWLYAAPEIDEGRVWVFYGAPGGIPTTASWIGDVNSVQAHLGLSIADAGDVDGDGYSDLVVGANGYDLGAGQFWGRAYLWNGSASGLSLAPDWSFDSDQEGAHLGAVGTAGDVNGDGYSDVVVSAPLYDAGATDTGRAYLFLGSASGLGTSPVWTTQSSQALAQFGNNIGGVGDVNGDGFGDVLVGADFTDAPIPDEGTVYVYAGGGAYGRPRPRDQRQLDGITPISDLGLSDDPSSFLVRVVARSAAGRERVRLQVDTKPTAESFDGTGRVTGSYVLLGAPAPGIGSTATLTTTPSGLVANTLYHWRARVSSRSPFFPRSPWLSPSTNAISEDDVRTGMGITGIARDRGAVTPGAVASFAVSSSLGANGATVRFALTRTAPVRLRVYDVRGRVVRTLVDDPYAPRGNHTVTWDGCVASGATAPSGVYEVLLTAESTDARTARVVLLP